MSAQRLSVVVPAYNESECLKEFYARLRSVLEKTGMNWEILFVNDGSTDATPAVLKELRGRDARVKLLHFSRNFGHQIAVKAGMDHASGDAVVVIDADLQDPPEAILSFLEKWREGYDVVYAVRVSRETDTFFKRWTATLFYRLLKKVSCLDIPLDTGDFRLLSSKVVAVMRAIREHQPFLRGLASWVGYRQTGVPIEREPRFAGRTKYPLKKMLLFAWSGITHFSFLPLQVCTMLGSLISFAAFLWMIQALAARFVFHETVAGWTSLMIAILFLGSAQLLTLGIMGSYLGRIFDEVRSRPLYILQETEGLGSAGRDA